MKNKYAGKCERCGMMVAAGDGNLVNQNGKWIVTHDGPCPEIESGLGIGGGKGFGAHGRCYDEECECCHELSDVVCNWCRCCEKCCVC